MKKNDQRTRTCFLEKYGRLSLYDIGFGKRYSIDDEDIHFLNGDRYALIGNPYHTYGTSTDHEYFCIHDDLFDRILDTDRNSDIILKVVHKEPSFSSINDNSIDSISKMRSRSEMVPPCHQLHRKQKEKVDDYYQKLFGNFNLIIVNLSPKLAEQENRSIANSFAYSYQDQCIETNTRRILTHVLNSWNENKSIAQPSTCALTPAETIALNIYSIELKQCS